MLAATKAGAELYLVQGGVSERAGRTQGAQWGAPGKCTQNEELWPLQLTPVGLKWKASSHRSPLEQTAVLLGLLVAASHRDSTWSLGLPERHLQPFCVKHQSLEVRELQDICSLGSTSYHGAAGTKRTKGHRAIAQNMTAGS